MLVRRFGPGQQAENYLVELRHRQQGPKESLQELGQAIHELVVKAYPELSGLGRDRLARNHFLDAIESQAIRESVWRARPNNFDEVIQAALQAENFEKIELQRRQERRPAKFARAV